MALFGDNTGLEIVIRARDEASKVLEGIKGKLQTVEPALKKMALVGTAGFAAIAGATVKATGDFAAFEKQIQRAGANVDASAEQLEIFRKVAKQAARETGVAATEAANALFFLAGGSISAEEASAALGETIKFAVANNISLTEATRQSAAIMTLFGLEAEEVSGALDVLTRAGQVSFATMDEMAAAFSEVAPIAAQVGVNITDLTAIIGVMGETGKLGSEAGVALKRAFSEILSPSKQMQEGLEGIGLTAEKLQSQLNNPIQLLETLETALKDVKDPIERATALSRIFGDISGPALAALLSVGTDAIKEMRGELKNSAGALEDTFKRIKEAQSPLELLNSELEVLSLTLGQALMEPLRGLIEAINPIIQALAEWIEQNPKLTQTILTVGAVGFGLMAVIGTLGLALSAIIPVISALGGALLFLATNPIALLIAAIVGVTILIVKNWDKIKAAWGATIDWIVAKLEAFGQFWVAVWDGIVSGLSAAWEFIKNIIQTTLAFIVGAIAIALDTILPNWQEHLEALASAWTTIWNAIKNTFATVWNTIANAISFGVNTTTTFVREKFEILRDGLSGVLDTIKNAWQIVWGSIRDFFIGIWQPIRDAVKGALDFILEKIQVVLDAWERMKAAVTTPIKNVGSAIGGFFSSAIERGKSMLGFQHGGVVPTPKGTPTPILAHGGETIIPAGHSTAKEGGAGITVNLNISGLTLRDESDMDIFTRKVEEVFRDLLINHKIETA